MVRLGVSRNRNGQVGTKSEDIGLRPANDSATSRINLCNGIAVLV